MKHSNTAILILSAAAFSVAGLSAPGAWANALPINGSIAFSSLGVTVNNADLGLASSFAVASPYVANNPTGDYSAVPALTSIAFTGFSFNPAVAAVTPLWSFDVGSIDYSYDATSVVADWNASRREWDIGGAGIAMITGSAATAGTWTLNLSQTGASFAFDATSGASGSVPGGSVPEGGSTGVLLSGVLLGLGSLGRKFRR